MGVQCQIIMWLRLHGALRVCPACQCGRTEMMSLLTCTCVVQAYKTQTYENPCNQIDRWKLAVAFYMLYLYYFMKMLLHFRNALINVNY